MITKDDSMICDTSMRCSRLQLKAGLLQVCMMLIKQSHALFSMRRLSVDAIFCNKFAAPDPEQVALYLHNSPTKFRGQVVDRIFYLNTKKQAIMHNKQNSNGTTPVVKLVKKSAFHDMAFDTNVNVQCDRVYTEQFAPRRDPIVFVFHDEFARLAQQLVNTTCHSTNMMHKMKMDPKTYTITDNMRFDTSAPIMQLPLSRQVRSNASLSVEKRENRNDLIPTNDHEHKLLDVRPSNPYSYRDATRTGSCSIIINQSKAPDSLVLRANPHSYVDATRLGKKTVSLTNATSNVHSAFPVQMDVSQQHLQRATQPGTVVKRSVIVPTVNVTTRRVLLPSSCNAVEPRQARTLKHALVVQMPTYTVYKIRSCTQSDSIITSARYAKLTPQSRSSHDFANKMHAPNPNEIHVSNGGGMVRDSLKHPTFVVTYADLEASNAYTSDRVEQHAGSGMRASIPSYSVSTQSQPHSSGRVDDMLSTSHGMNRCPKLHATQVSSNVESSYEMNQGMNQGTSDRENRFATTQPTVHYTQVTYDHEFAQPHMNGPTLQNLQNRPRPSITSTPHLPEYDTARLDNNQRMFDMRSSHTTGVDYQPLQSFDDCHVQMETQTAERRNLQVQSHRPVHTNKSPFVRNPITQASASMNPQASLLTQPPIHERTTMSLGTQSNPHIRAESSNMSTGHVETGVAASTALNGNLPNYSDSARHQMHSSIHSNSRPNIHQEAHMRKPQSIQNHFEQENDGRSSGVITVGTSVLPTYVDAERRQQQGGHVMLVQESQHTQAITNINKSHTHSAGQLQHDPSKKREMPVVESHLNPSLLPAHDSNHGSTVNIQIVKQQPVRVTTATTNTTNNASKIGVGGDAYTYLKLTPAPSTQQHASINPTYRTHGGQGSHDSEQNGQIDSHRVSALTVHRMEALRMVESHEKGDSHADHMQI